MATRSSGRETPRGSRPVAALAVARAGSSETRTGRCSGVRTSRSATSRPSSARDANRAHSCRESEQSPVPIDPAGTRSGSVLDAGEDSCVNRPGGTVRSSGARSSEPSCRVDTPSRSVSLVLPCLRRVGPERTGPPVPGGCLQEEITYISGAKSGPDSVRSRMKPPQSSISGHGCCRHGAARTALPCPSHRQNSGPRNPSLDLLDRIWIAPGLSLDRSLIASLS